MEELEMSKETPRKRRRSLREDIDESDHSMFVKLWMRIKSDVRSAQLWKIKLLFLLHSAARSSLFQFLTIHLKSLGITVAETSYIYTIIPFTSMLSPPFMGYVADRIGNFRLFMASMGIITGLLPMTFLLVPSARDNIYLPMDVPANLSCTNETFNLVIPQQEMCPTKDSIEYLVLSVDSCMSDCQPVLRWNGTEIHIGLEKQKEESGAKNIFYILISKLETQSNYSQSCEGFLNAMNLTSIESRCSLHCEVTLPRDQLCIDPYYTIDRGVPLTFWTMLFLRVFFSMLSAGYLTLMDGTVMAIIEQRHGDLGLQHIWSMLGGMAFSPLAGYLLDYFSRGKAVTDYSPAFYLFASFKFMCAILISQLDLTFKQSSSTVLKDLKDVILKNPQLIAFYCICFLSGLNFGFLENFLYWFLEDLGADKALMGLTSTVSAVPSIICLMFAGVIIHKFGHISVIAFSLLALAIRCLGYSLINDPVMALPYEVLQCFTSSMMMTAFDMYAAKLSTISTITSVMGIMNALQFGLGRGSGSLVGGLLVEELGMRKTFRFFSICSFIIAIAYFLFYFCYVRRLEIRKEKKQKIKDSLQ